MKDCDLALPPGFRFHPTDEELVMHYLCRKCASLSISVSIIAEIDLYKYDPWLLPGMASYGEKEWYFFSPRDRKYPNGSRPNRAAGSGYWKATGADKPIGNPKPVGIKKALVFYIGKAPRGLKTNWIMHEYRLADVDRSVRKKNLRLDDWVLCRIYNKKGVVSDKGIDGKLENRTHNINGRPATMAPPRVITLSGNGITNNHDFVHYETSDSMPKLHSESSGSEHVVSDSPEMKCEREVQSEARWMDWERALDLQINKVNAIASSHNYSQLESNQQNQLSPLQDMFMYLHKPF